MGVSKYEGTPLGDGDSVSVAGGLDSRGLARALPVWQHQGDPDVYEGVIANAGDTVLVTPSPGKSLRVFWVSVQPSPDADTTPQTRLRLGPRGLYRVYWTQHRERFDGNRDEPLIISLSAAGPVLVTVHYEEF